MPEGHSVHRAARDQAGWLAGEALLVSSPQGRFEEAAALDGRRLVAVEARGKHLFYRWRGLRRQLHVHLGQFGRFRKRRVPPPEPRGAVRLRLVGARHAIDLVGPTACEMLDTPAREALLARLGPDPLAGDSPQPAWEAASRKRAPIGAALLDQRWISGIGNVYRAELLHILGLDPRTPTRDLSAETLDLLWRESVRLLEAGVELGKIVTLDVEQALAGRRTGRLRERLRVYGRRRCAVCEGPVETLSLASRKHYWCPACQEGCA